MVTSTIRLEVTDPVKILKLYRSLSDNESKHLEVKLNGYFRTESESTSVFPINMSSKYEASVQTINGKILKTVRVPVSSDCRDGVINMADCSSTRLHPDLQRLIGEVSRGHPDRMRGDYMCVPVINCHAPVFVYCFVNSTKNADFVVRLVNECFRFCLVPVLNVMELEEEARIKNQCQSLLQVARKFLSCLGNLDSLLQEIMTEARRLTNAERCALFLIDFKTNELVARVFEGLSGGRKSNDIRISINQGIVGHVATTGVLQNIRDVQVNPLFCSSIDHETGFRTRSILCFPIFDQGRVIGVAQLLNKQGDEEFDSLDEEVATTFGVYCGISIRNGLLYKKLEDARERNKLCNEMMMYHMRVRNSQVADVLLCPSAHSHPHLDKFRFSPRDIILKESPCFVLEMIRQLNFVETFEIPKETFVRFILYVQKGYRDTPYHNWYHALSVAHFAYLCIKNFKLDENKYLTSLENFSLFISCLCHDIDHRGTTNSFQKQSNSTLASLYSSEGSVMERHHLNQTLCILNTEGCNILETLPSDQYKKCLDYIKDMILATDLANHFKGYKWQLAMAQEGYKRNKKDHRYALVSLLMTCADLSDQTKPFRVVKQVAQAVCDEFFREGDLEKRMGHRPMSMMDRDTCSIPDLQIEFIGKICLPVYKILTLMFPAAKALLDEVKNNVFCWEVAKRVLTCKTGLEQISLDVLRSVPFEDEVLRIVKQIKGGKT